jgi:hypothetical protein
MWNFDSEREARDFAFTLTQWGIRHTVRGTQVIVHSNQ